MYIFHMLLFAFYIYIMCVFFLISNVVILYIIYVNAGTTRTLSVMDILYNLHKSCNNIINVHN